MKRLKRVWNEIRQLWKKLKSNWKTKYRLVIKSEATHQDKFSLKLSPKNVFVVVTTSAVLLILLTTMLIAFTPLRVYVPGYTNPDEYRMYKKLAVKVDSMNTIMEQNQQYIDNFYKVLHDEVLPEEMQQETGAEKKEAVKPKKEKQDRPKEDAQIRKEAYDLTHSSSGNGTNSAPGPLKNKAGVNTLFMQAPVLGMITAGFDALHKHYGIDMANQRNTIISSIADGIVLFSGFDPQYGNTIIIQHAGNIVSQYKCNETLLKTAGQRVAAGEPIARMGSTGILEKGVHLHFELWYNGFPVNPLDYLTIE